MTAAQAIRSIAGALSSLGNDGWEVIGQVKTRNVTSGMLVPQLLLKRRRIV